MPSRTHIIYYELEGRADLVRYLERRWYIYAFAAVMAFAAGVSTEWECGGSMAAAVSAIGDMNGAGLLRLSGYALLSGAALYSMAAIAKGVLTGGILKAAALWIKSFLMGFFARTVIEDWPGLIGIPIIALSFMGGLCLCMGLMVGTSERDAAKGQPLRMKMALFAAGALTEGIALPSLIRTAAMLSK